MDCNVDYQHVHQYITDDGFMTYRDSEYETEGDLYWTNNVRAITDDLDELDKFNFFKIEDNIKVLEKNIEKNIDYMEYEYKYRYRSFSRIGKRTFPFYRTRKKFTEDSNHTNLTGRVRDVYKYKAYRIVTD